jgi:hypothetical protein
MSSCLSVGRNKVFISREKAQKAEKEEKTQPQMNAD